MEKTNPMTDNDNNHPIFISPWNEPMSEILGVHLHRYLMPLLMDHKLGHIWILTGFEASQMPSLTLKVSAYGSELEHFNINYNELVTLTRQNGLTKLQHFQVNDKDFVAFPILSISEPGREHIHAFALYTSSKIFEQDIFADALRTRINEAIRAFRHNSLRILFDDSETQSPKEFITQVLNAIPVWCGADHSASLILSSSLESMVLSPTGPAQFQIVAEKCFAKPQDPDKNYDLLIGLDFTANQLDAGLLGYAFEEVRLTRAVTLNIFINSDDNPNAWFLLGETQKSAYRFTTSAYRPKENLTLIIPLLCKNELKDNELMGFLSINFTNPIPLSSLSSRVLETLASRLANYLRRSSFFSLSSQQLWLLECIREEQLATSRLFRDTPELHTDERIYNFIAKVNKLVAMTTKLPCFAIGYKTIKDDEEVLRFISPHGVDSTDFDIPIHTNEPQHSSIATLALRLNRPITLSGGKTQDGETEFNNHIYVNEELGLLADIRLNNNSINKSWNKLSDYYKPTREKSYASIAYPIRMDDDVIGSIVVEVDRDTDWLWWTGFGSYLFYRLLANELAADFALLGLK